METRGTPRISINLKVISKTVDNPQQKFKLASGNSFEVNVVDIGVGGIGLVSKYFLPKGLIIELEIEGSLLGLKGNMNIKGEICYCRFDKSIGYRCGVKFIDVSDDFKKAILEFISTHERREYPRLKLSD